MKRVLLDENVAHALRKHLSNHETVTAAYAGFAGLKNGELLKAAVESGFDVLVTSDKPLQYEQNLSGDKIAVVSLSANGWRIIAPYVAKIAAAVDDAVPGSFVRVEPSRGVAQNRKGHRPDDPKQRSVAGDSGERSGGTCL